MKLAIVKDATLAIVFFLTFLLTTLPLTARAFYELREKDISLDLRGMVRGFGIAYENPENDFFFKDRSESGIGGLARIIVQAQTGQHLGFELNAYQTYIPNELVLSRAGLSTSLDVERCGALEWSFSDERYVHLAVDHLNIRWSQGPLDLIVGRQPINMATTFYFTPNDFFAPFAAQTFYRVYKPGVDAVRAEVRLGELSQLSLMGVNGYKRGQGSETGWSDEADGDRASYLGRVSTVYRDFELALLGGVVRDEEIIGGSLQGELFKWLGVRAEGHIENPNDSPKDRISEFSLGIEHRWESSLNIRLEQFYHGRGVGSASDYGISSFSATGRGSYLGRNYTALGVGYEFSPLLNGELLVITNLNDYSYLISSNATYSLSDEAEIAVNLGAPIGDKPEGPKVMSEFGLYPYSVNVEVRYYF